MLRGIVVLLGFQLAGEAIVHGFGIEFPGPVVGMLLFFAALRWRRPGPASALVQAPTLLLRHLQLLFVPAGVGIVVYLHTLRDEALPLAAGLWISWLVGFVVTALTVSGLLRLQRGRR